jgi:hypothetical protein
VAETLRAILAQTHPDLEVLVSDDGSTDDTVAVLREAAGDDPRVTILANDNVGIFANPVRLLRMASSDLVKFVLQDDLLDPACIEVLAGAMADPDVVLAASKRRRIDGHGRPLPDDLATVALLDGEGRVPGLRAGDHLLETQCNRIGELSTVLFRRSAVDVDGLWEVPGWKARGNGDVAVYLQLLSTGDLWYTPRELSSFRTHEGQFGSSAKVVVDCTVDWPHLIEGGRRLGFLADPEVERRGLERWTHTARAVLAAHGTEPGAAELHDLLAAVEARLRPPPSQPQPNAGRVAVGVAVLGDDLDVAALGQVVDADCPIAECPVETTVEDAWDEILEVFARDESVDGVLLLRSDALPTDPELRGRIRARLSGDPLVGLFGDTELDGLVVARWAAGALRFGSRSLPFATGAALSQV